MNKIGIEAAPFFLEELLPFCYPFSTFVFVNFVYLYPNHDEGEEKFP